VRDLRVPRSVGVKSLAAPPPAPRGLSYAVDIVFCIDVTGSMTPIIDAVKANALRFYDDVQINLTAKGKNVDELRVRVIAFRDFVADGEMALEESPFFALPQRSAVADRFRQVQPVDRAGAITGQVLALRDEHPQLDDQLRPRAPRSDPDAGEPGRQ
jgi:hypothetical protein